MQPQQMGQSSFIFVPYSYLVSSSSLAHGSSVQVPLVLDQDADFELHEVYGYTDVDDPTEFRPNNFSVQITDKNNSRIWSSGRIAQITFTIPPWTLSRPVLLAKRSNLMFDFLNITSATDSMTCSVVFHGYKVYITQSSGYVPVSMPTS